MVPDEGVAGDAGQVAVEAAGALAVAQRGNQAAGGEVAGEVPGVAGRGASAQARCVLPVPMSPNRTTSSARPSRGFTLQSAPSSP